MARRSATVWVPCALASRSRSGVHPCTMVVEWADGFRFTEKAILPEGFIKLVRLSTPYHHMADPHTDAVCRLGGRLCGEFEQKVANALGRNTVAWRDGEQALFGNLIHKIGMNVWTALDTTERKKREAAMADVKAITSAMISPVTSGPAGAAIGAVLGGALGAAVGHFLGTKKDEK